MLAGVDRQHPTVKEQAVLLSHCLVLILRVNVLKNLLRSQWFPIVVIPFDPQTRSKIVLIIGHIDVIFAKLLLFLLYIFISSDLHETPFVSDL